MEKIAAAMLDAIRVREDWNGRVVQHVQQLIDAAKADGLGKGRRCVVVGELAVYIDPPEFSGTGDWSVSWGTKPVTTG